MVLCATFSRFRAFWFGLLGLIDTVGSGEVSRGEKMLESGTDPESYITEYTLVYE